jgi:hypothetical protein
MFMVPLNRASILRSCVHSSLSTAYGHGAIATALYLSDSVGADAFAVATLEEAIALRKAFLETVGGSSNSLQPNKVFVASLFPKGGDESMTLSTLPTNSTITGRKRSARPPNIRILVLGPPVGFPRCFDDYFHHNIEVMISGPEVAKALYQWVHDPDERKRTQVERSAMEVKEMALKGHPPAAPRSMPNPVMEQRDSTVSDASTSENSQSSDTVTPRHHRPP